jgi:hypothetical protein
MRAVHPSFISTVRRVMYETTDEHRHPPAGGHSHCRLILDPALTFLHHIACTAPTSRAEGL